MMQDRILIHIGYHKTGSTFLQKSVFSHQEFGFCYPWSRGDYFEQLILVNPFTFDNHKVRKLKTKLNNTINIAIKLPLN